MHLHTPVMLIESYIERYRQNSMPPEKTVGILTLREDNLIAELDVSNREYAESVINVDKINEQIADMSEEMAILRERQALLLREMERRKAVAEEAYAKVKAVFAEPPLVAKDSAELTIPLDRDI